MVTATPTPDFAEDDLVRELLPNGGPPPGAQIILGWLGRGPAEGFWRIYTTIELDAFAEVEQADILTTRKVEGAALGRTAVWLRRDAIVRTTRTQSAERHAAFLRGSVVAASRSQAGMGVFGIDRPDQQGWTLILIPFLGFALGTVIFTTLPDDSAGCGPETRTAACATNASHCC